jgi:hypothetical protein
MSQMARLLVDQERQLEAEARALSERRKTETASRMLRFFVQREERQLAEAGALRERWAKFILVKSILRLESRIRLQPCERPVGSTTCSVLTLLSQHHFASDGTGRWMAARDKNSRQRTNWCPCENQQLRQDMSS